MKIAIASEGKSIEDNVSPIFGRADFFLIFEDKKIIKTISNPFKVGGGGAGFGVTQMLAKEGVELVIAGKFGPKVMDFLADKKMKYKIISDKKVKRCLDQD